MIFDQKDIMKKLINKKSTTKFRLEIKSTIPKNHHDFADKSIPDLGRHPVCHMPWAVWLDSGR